MRKERFQSGRGYLVDGATLNEIFDAIQEQKLLSTDQYGVRIVPGAGTMLTGLKGTGEGGPGRKIWDLVIVDAEAGKVSVDCGTIIKDDLDLSAGIAIADAAEIWTVEAGDYLYLELSGGFDSPVCELRAGTAWTDFPSAVEIDGSGDDPEFVAYYYPLWSFHSTGAPDRLQIAENLHARRLVGDHHFLRSAAAWDNQGDWPIAVPVLLPYHRVV